MWDLLLQTAGAGLPMLPGLLGMDAKDTSKYGGLFGLGTGVLQGLGKAFGITDSGGSGAQSPQGLKDLDTLGKLQQMSSYTQTGAEGAAANRESAEAARRFIGQQTAEGRLAAQTQRNLGAQALGGAQETTDLARAAAMTNLGNQRRDLMQQSAAAGASPAALAAMASNLGQANTQTLGALAQQGAAAQQAGLSQAGQAFSAAEQTRGADLAQQLANFQPYALQKNAATNAGALGQLGQYAQTGAQTSAMEDPTAWLKAQGGQGATQLAQRPFEDETATRQFFMSLAKDPALKAKYKELFT